MNTLVKTGTATAVTAAIGTLASQDVRTAWYARLSKPSFQPPAAAFPIVWTALYADVALSSAAVLDGLQRDDRDAEAAAYQRALGVNLALNASWTWVFFKAHQPGPAVAVAGALTVSCVDLVRRAARTSTPAAAALSPYAAWCGFATVLSAAIWRRNR